MPLKRIVTRSMQRYWRISRGLALGVRGMTADANGGILLVQPSHATTWQLPGGTVEAGETVEMAIRRKLAEQTGLQIDRSPELFGIYADLQNSQSRHIAVFVIQSWHHPEPSKALGTPFQTAFFSADSLPPNSEPETRRRISELLNLTPKSHNW